jgi:galactonate dehydratase
MVGTGITTAYTMHLGAILTHAQLPAITCHELWEHHLLVDRLEVSGGMISVPELPGLGVEVDESALAYYRVEPGTPTLTQEYKQRQHTCRVHIPDDQGGETVHDFNGESIYYPTFSEGKYPGFVPGVWMEVIDTSGKS